MMRSKKASSKILATLCTLTGSLVLSASAIAVNPGGPAGVEDLPASDVTQFSATLNATVNPGVIPASYHFAYGTTNTYGSITPIPDRYVVPGYAENKIAQIITGLRPGTTYHYALIAADVAGIVTGPDQTFTTPPVPIPQANTGSAIGITRSTAALAGTIDPMAWDTAYHYQYGTSTTYGSSWPTIDIDMGALTGDQPVLITLENLQPGTTYHYRLVATNPGGTTYGTDQTFTTAEYPVSIVQANPVGGSLGITPATTQPKAKAKAHKHAGAKHKRRKPKKKK
jgi:phosphodiesterase/alkaline phosphatase D-like protein